MGHIDYSNTCGNRCPWSGKEKDGDPISKIPRNIRIQEVERCVVFGSAIIVRRSLSIWRNHHMLMVALSSRVGSTSSVNRAEGQRKNNTNNKNY